MQKVKYFQKTIIILILTGFLILTSFSLTADIKTKHSLLENSCNLIDNKETVYGNKIDTDVSCQKQNTQDFPRGLFFEVLKGVAEGKAISGKVLGFRGKIVKINFEYLKIEVRRLFPLRWEMSNFYNTTAFMFNVNQTIPQGAFDFESEWVVAIVFK